MAASIATRSRVFLDVQCGPDFLGRIVIELFSDKTPKTCENFRAICASSHTPPSAARPLSYKNCPFHRIIDEFMIQGGDITAHNGTGGASIYGGNFQDENIGWRKIDAAGLVCMANRGRDTNSSQFFITLAPCEHLNTKHTIFGHVVKGMDVCERMAKIPVDDIDRPLCEVVIAHCGELERRPKPGTAPQQSTGKQKWEPQRSQQKANGDPRYQRSSSRSTASGSHSRSPPGRRKRHEPSIASHRRSDAGRDENRRGRDPRSASPHVDSSRSPPRRRPYRRRSSPPSRSRSPRRSRPPHLRRKPTDRERSPPNGTRFGPRDRPLNESDRKQDGRLGGDNDDEEGSGIRFKGRGSMKYREQN